MNRMPGCVWLCLAHLWVAHVTCNETGAAERSLTVPAGFQVSLFADDELAHDVFSMTVNAQGQVVVSGPGYIRTLLDKDGDGLADGYRTFADGPASGAQGMVFDGNDVICTGDKGLIRYRDSDGDGVADGPPETLLPIKTGGEHHAHSIQRGADGWWYLIAGNNAGVTKEQANVAGSPIRRPSAGVVLRIRPDFSGSQIYCDGFRNAYDFAFNSRGDLFVYDSDGERDVSLPWYRPTRVFQPMAGTNAGWYSRSWKRPDEYLEMPHTLASFGRGSPTGVACYRHHAFPVRYRDAIFVADWTFGRVLALPLQRNGSVWKSDPIAFVTPAGHHGFAPTDLAVAPDGSLLVSVGGRGTRGGVYRIAATTSTLPDEKGSNDPDVGGIADTTNPSDVSAKAIRDCLLAPQPQSSWSRSRWLATARRAGRVPFENAVVDSTIPPAGRLRAIEILTEFYGGAGLSTVAVAAADSSPAIRSHVAWSLGRVATTTDGTAALVKLSRDNHAVVRRQALESLLLTPDVNGTPPILKAIRASLFDEDRFVRQSAAMLLARILRTPDAGRAKFVSSLPLWSRTCDAGDRATKLDLALAETAIKQLPELRTAARLPETIRSIQRSLGDVGPRAGQPGVLDGYQSAAWNATTPVARDPVHRAMLDSFRRLYPTNNPYIDRELERLLAIVGRADPLIVDTLISRLDTDSHPTDDLHRLVTIACLATPRSSRQQQIIARTLLTLDSKIAARKLRQDRNWDVRLGELFRLLMSRDSDLPAAMLSASEFGQSGHLVFVKLFSNVQRQRAVDVFAERVKTARTYTWTPELIELLGRHPDPRTRQRVRDQYDSWALQGAVLRVLAKKPDPADRAKFVDGLKHSDPGMIKLAVSALEALPRSNSGAEQYALLGAARRLLAADDAGFATRRRLIKMMAASYPDSVPYPDRFDPAMERMAIDSWGQLLGQKFPELKLADSSAVELTALDKRLESVRWESGVADRGRTLFGKLSCSQCHEGRRSLGPDLAGVARRFSRRDLFVALTMPSRDVSPRYQTVQIRTQKGVSFSGIIIYESVDGVLLRDMSRGTIRIESNEMELRRSVALSLMPPLPLSQLDDTQLADLYAYLSTFQEAAKDKNE